MLASPDSKSAGRIVDDPCRAVTHSRLAERAIVLDEAASDVIRGRPDEQAHKFDAQARRAADKRLRAFPRDDLRDLTALRENWVLRVRVCNAFEQGPRITSYANEDFMDGAAIYHGLAPRTAKFWIVDDNESTTAELSTGYRDTHL